MFCKLIQRLRGKRPPHIEVFKDVAAYWRVRITAANGEILMSSESYATEGNAWRAARTLAAQSNLEVL